MKAEQFEQKLLKLLSEPIPKRKYELWQQVEQGQIVGYHWECVAYCFGGIGREYGGFPGWYYHVFVDDKQGGSIKEYHEDDISPGQAFNEPPPSH